MIRHSILILITAVFCLCSCHNSGPPIPTRADTAAVSELVKKAYQWHTANSEKLPDYTVIVQDSFQVSLDTNELNAAIDAMRKTNFFSEAFLQNYRQVGMVADGKLRSDTHKYYDEVNFAFQDADPWTFFQDDADNFPDNMRMKIIHISPDSASVSWTVDDDPGADEYNVRLIKEKRHWKIDYLQGFDAANNF